MSNLADDAIKPPFGLASLFFAVVAALSLAATGYNIMASNAIAAGSSFSYLWGSIFALAVLKALREILHELRRARAGV